MFSQYLYNLTDINQYLTDAENKFNKTLVTSVTYWLNISLLRFLP